MGFQLQLDPVLELTVFSNLEPRPSGAKNESDKFGEVLQYFR
jgi:hypothetical protein